MTSSSGLMCRRRNNTTSSRSFMINDILHTQAQSFEKENKDFDSFRSVYPFLLNSRASSDFPPEVLPQPHHLGPVLFPRQQHSTVEDMTSYSGRVNPYAKFGLGFTPSQAGLFLCRAAELMANNCVLPPMPLSMSMQPYDRLPFYLRDRLLHFAEGGMGSRKCRRSRTVFSDLQLMALEERFERQKYLSTPDRMELAEGLGLTQLQVKTWYQNRRMKWKKQVQQTDESRNSPREPEEMATQINQSTLRRQVTPDSSDLRHLGPKSNYSKALNEESCRQSSDEGTASSSPNVQHPSDHKPHPFHPHHIQHRSAFTRQSTHTIDMKSINLIKSSQSFDR